MHILRMYVPAEGANSRLADNLLPALGGSNQCRVSTRQPVVENRMEESAFAIDFNVVALPGVTFPGKGVTEQERSSQRKPSVALLARQRHGPEVAPRLVSLVLW